MSTAVWSSLAVWIKVDSPVQVVVFPDSFEILDSELPTRSSGACRGSMKAAEMRAEETIAIGGQWLWWLVGSALEETMPSNGAGSRSWHFVSSRWW